MEEYSIHKTKRGQKEGMVDVEETVIEDLYEKENFLFAKKYLNDNHELLKSLRESRSHLSISPHGTGEKYKKEYQNHATAGDIIAWLGFKATKTMSGNLWHNLRQGYEAEERKKKGRRPSVFGLENP